jgi:hypothetical protein
MRKSHFGKTDEDDFVQVMGGGNCTLAGSRHAMGAIRISLKSLLNNLAWDEA